MINKYYIIIMYTSCSCENELTKDVNPEHIIQNLPTIYKV